VNRERVPDTPRAVDGGVVADAGETCRALVEALAADFRSALDERDV